MAHEIENNEIAFKNEVPWHGLGVRVNPDATGIEMLQAAGLDWTVQRRALAMRPSKDSKELITAELDGFRAIVRSDNNVVFQVAKARYNPVQNAEIIDVFREYCEAGHASMETVGAIKGGCIVWALAKLNGVTSTTIAGDDKLTGYLLLATSHDGTVRTIGKATQVRVVCNNTLTAAMEDGKATFSLKHSAKWTSAMKEQAKSQMGMAIEAIQRTNENAVILSQVSINDADWLTFMGKLMNDPDAVTDPKTHQLTRLAQDIQSATVSSPGSFLRSAKGTLWGAVNGVTYFADHQRGRSADSRLASAWFGESESLKTRAMEVALEMAVA